jgi:peptide/nickel transport system permease protein
LTIPALLIALMVDGLARATLSPEIHDEIALYMLIFAIGIADWPQYARVVRAATLVQRQSGYVVQAKLIGSSAPSIVFGHVLPNVMTSVLVLATLGLALAIIAEATLSFLGVGMPPTTPSLGTLIRVGNDFLFSGEWWITLFPSLVLVLLALSVNLLGDWLRDALNPRLR